MKQKQMNLKQKQDTEKTMRLLCELVGAVIDGDIQAIADKTNEAARYIEAVGYEYENTKVAG